MQKVKMIAQGRVQGVGFRWGVSTVLPWRLVGSLAVSGIMTMGRLVF